MPRDGSGVFAKPAGTTPTDGDDLESNKYNLLMDDFVSDANVPRPISAGGTGATTKSAARTELGLKIGTNVQQYSSELDAIGATPIEEDEILYGTADGVWGKTGISPKARSLLERTTGQGMRNELDLGGLAEVDILDEDDFATESETQPPSQASTKAFVGTEIGSALAGVYASSGSVTFATATATSWTHGQASIPDSFGARLVCFTANNGYGVGDKINIGADVASFVQLSGASDTEVFQSFQTAEFNIPIRAGGGFAAVNTAEWRLELWGLWFS